MFCAFLRLTGHIASCYHYKVNQRTNEAISAKRQKSNTQKVQVKLYMVPKLSNPTLYKSHEVVGVGKLGKRGKETKKHKLVVTK